MSSVHSCPGQPLAREAVCPEPPFGHRAENLYTHSAAPVGNQGALLGAASRPRSPKGPVGRPGAVCRKLHGRNE